MSALRGILRRVRAEAFERLGRNARARARLDGTCAVILTYHRVLPRDEARRLAVEPGMYVTPETFAGHLDWLAEDLRVLPLAEVVERLSAGASLPRGACALTFDDGWRDNHDHALPALVRRGLPATLFVVTDRVGTPGAFWPDEVCRRAAALPPAARPALARALGVAPGRDPAQALLARLKALPEPEREALLEALRERARALGAPDPPAARELLTWDELDALARGGVAVESHGRTHALLTRVDPERAAAELRASREVLRRRGHGAGALLAWPSGAHDARVRALAREAGYRAAVGTEPGLARPGADPLALPRLGLHEDVSASRAELRARVPGAAP